MVVLNDRKSFTHNKGCSFVPKQICTVISVTKIGKFSPILRNIEGFWTIVGCSFRIRQNFEHTLEANFMVFGLSFVVLNGQNRKKM